MDFEETYQSYFINVYRFVCSLTPDKNLVEEITQETFLKAMEAIEQFDDRKDILAWLFTIARNTYYSHCRRQKHLTEKPEQVYCEDPLLERLIKREQADAIYSFLHRMKEPYKEVFTLRVLGELSYSRIGKIFGKSEGWARVTYYRAKRMITEHMEDSI